MKKTIFALLACATLVAPAMAVDDNICCFTTVSPFGTDSTTSHYAVYTLYSEEATVADLAQLYAQTTYKDFISSSTIDWPYIDVDMGTKTGEIWAEFLAVNETSVDASHIFVTWVYNSGEDDTYQFMIIQGEKQHEYDEIFYAQVVADGDEWQKTQTNSQKWTKFAPEPATATLSLLALAGLAARRRRH